MQVGSGSAGQWQPRTVTNARMEGGLNKDTWRRGGSTSWWKWNPSPAAAGGAAAAGAGFWNMLFAPRRCSCSRRSEVALGGKHEAAKEGWLPGGELLRSPGGRGGGGEPVSPAVPPGLSRAGSTLMVGPRGRLPTGKAARTPSPAAQVWRHGHPTVSELDVGGGTPVSAPFDLQRPLAVGANDGAGSGGTSFERRPQRLLWPKQANKPNSGRGPCSRPPLGSQTCPSPRVAVGRLQPGGSVVSAGRR